MSIGRKFTLWIISLVFVVGLLSTYLYYSSQTAEETERLRSLGNTIGPLLEHSLGNYMLTRNSGALDDTLNDLKSVRPIRRILLLNNEGVVKASTNREDIGARIRGKEGECRGCHDEGRSGLFLRQEGIFRWVQPVANTSECHRCHDPSVRDNGVFVIDFSTGEFESYARRNIAKGFSIFFPSMGLIALVIFLISNTIIKRLTAVTEKIGRFKEGDYNVRTVSRGDDEITKLEEAFNDMARAIHVRETEKNLLFRQASRSRLEWQYTFDSITELIAIIDTDFSIVRANRTFLEYFGLASGDWRRRKCLDFFYGKEAPQGYGPFASAMKEDQTATEEIDSADGRTFRISTFPYTYPDADFRGAILVAREITEEKALRRNDEKRLHFLQALIDAIPNPIFYKDAQGIYLGCNEAFESYLGSEREKIVGRTVYDVAPKELADRYREADLSLYGDPGVQTYESSVMRADGSRRDVIFYKSTFLNSDGVLGGLVGTILDITDRKQAEKIIKRNFDMQKVINSILKDAQEEIGLTEILQRAIEHILSLDWLCVRSMGSISLVESEPDVLVMKAQKRLPEHLVGMCARVHFGRCICGRAAAERAVQYMDHVDHRHELCSESAHPHGHYCVPILYVDRTIGVLNIYLDEGTKLSHLEMEYFGAIAAALAGIIQHKRAEEEREKLILRLQDALNMVSRSQKEWQDTFDSITDLVSIHDRQYNIIRANRAAADYFGIPPKEIIRRKCYELFHESGSPTASCPHRTTMREDRAMTEEISDGKTGRIFRISTFPYYSAEGDMAGTVHIARDITEEKNNEMRLIMSERLASLGQMASGIAHEINNPLAAIAGCAEGLLNRVHRERYDRDLFENYLAIILEEISRCKNITSGMLSFIRKTTYEKKDIDINRAIEKTVEIIGFQGRLQGVEVVRDFGEDLPLVPGSEGELRQIFITVITNALDAMREKGTLTLRTAAEGKAVVLEISDTGDGIPPSEINRIFDPFFTTKSERGGTGLGLSIARKIVMNHNGGIEVSSPGPGSGTTFRITLPFKQHI